MAKRKRQPDSNSSSKSLLPQKRHYRQRAHANPFSDHALQYPAAPAAVDWAAHYPAFAATHKSPEFADIGCGFGGLLVALAPLFPDALILGLEIRVQVSQYVEDRIAALRASAAPAPAPAPAPNDAPAAPAAAPTPGPYQNISIVRANAMKFLPNYFPKASLRALFLLFPDPHFKARKHKARIVSRTLLAEYAYALRPGAIAFTVTDVADLHRWIAAHFDESPLFARVAEARLREEGWGAVLDAVMRNTEEGKKVERNGGDKFLACFRRVDVQRVDDDDDGGGGDDDNMSS